MKKDSRKELNGKKNFYLHQLNNLPNHGDAGPTDASSCCGPQHNPEFPESGRAEAQHPPGDETPDDGKYLKGKKKNTYKLKIFKKHYLIL